MPETVSFNLIDEPWLPCIRLGELKPELLSLRALFRQAHTLREIYADSPLTTAALYRLCLALLHSAFKGPQKYSVWEAWWENRATGLDVTAIDAYLDKHHDQFDLFGERPFYQGGLLPDNDASGDSVIFLKIGVDKNMATLFSHYTEGAQHHLSFARAAQEVITVQTFALGGGVSGEGQPNFTDAPWARGIVFLAEGDNLCETLLLNLIRYPIEPAHFQYQKKGDRPRWEVPDDWGEKGKRTPQGYLDYLTWASRRILLAPPQLIDGEWRVTHARYAHGLSLPKGKDEDLRDPLKRNQDKDKPKPDESPSFPLAFNPAKALWRDSYSLFSKVNAKVHRPLVCDWLAELAQETGVLDKHHPYRLIAFGLAADKANIDFARAERLPLHLAFLENESLVGYLSDATTQAENVGTALHRALKELAWGLVEKRPLPKAPAPEPVATSKGKPKKKPTAESEGKEVKSRDALVASWGADAPYWSTLETEFWIFVQALAGAQDDPEQQKLLAQAWKTTLRQQAQEALQNARHYAGDHPRAFRAFAVAEWKLNAGLKAALGAALAKPASIQK